MNQRKAAIKAANTKLHVVHAPVAWLNVFNELKMLSALTLMMNPLHSSSLPTHIPEFLAHDLLDN
jgi:hypothetical protein